MNRLTDCPGYRYRRERQPKRDNDKPAEADNKQAGNPTNKLIGGKKQRPKTIRRPKIGR